ncbi:MAG: hypothetical protein MNPFHGCM_02203 [Gemmatimonadaceae bacterium]|nr:hypothetical protein [Gemmatimonadaceae bacterium]
MTPRQREFPDGSDDASRWESIARVSGETASPEEMARVRAHLARNRADAEFLELLDRELPMPPRWDVGDAEVDVALRKVNARRLSSSVPALRLVASSKAPRRWVVIPLAAAAAIVLASTLALWARREGAHEASANGIAVTTGAGERSSINLADGTRIVVAPFSTVRIAPGFERGNGPRMVELMGQAMFTVQHDASRPFVVATRDAIVEDIGTQFTVRSVAADSVVVHVTEGSVQLRSRTSSLATVTLAAGDVGVLSSGAAVAIRGRVIARDTAWAHGAIEFRDAPMAEVREQFRRWYGVHLRVADGVLERRHVTATLEDEPLDRALQIVALALGAEVERHADTAIVRLPRAR